MTQPHRHRSEAVWAEARDDYLKGMTAEQVCRRHDLGLSALRRRARLHGWRRHDQPDPQPQDDDLAIYRDLDLADLTEMMHLRLAQAISQGRATEAARWMRLIGRIDDIAVPSGPGPQPEPPRIEASLPDAADTPTLATRALEEPGLHSLHPKNSDTPLNRRQRRRQLAKLRRSSA